MDPDTKPERQTRLVDVFGIEVSAQELNTQEYWWPVRVMYGIDLRMMNMFVRLPDDIEKWEDIASDELAYEVDA